MFKGDSGGPLVCDGILAGVHVASWTDIYCAPPIPSSSQGFQPIQSGSSILPEFQHKLYMFTTQVWS